MQLLWSICVAFGALVGPAFAAGVDLTGTWWNMRCASIEIEVRDTTIQGRYRGAADILSAHHLIGFRSGNDLIAVRHQRL